MRVAVITLPFEVLCHAHLDWWESAGSWDLRISGLDGFGLFAVTSWAFLLAQGHGSGDWRSFFGSVYQPNASWKTEEGLLCQACRSDVLHEGVYQQCIPIVTVDQSIFYGYFEGILCFSHLFSIIPFEIHDWSHWTWCVALRCAGGFMDWILRLHGVSAYPSGHNLRQDSLVQFPKSGTFSDFGFE